jgi:hypothetical protein
MTYQMLEILSEAKNLILIIYLPRLIGNLNMVFET